MSSGGSCCSRLRELPQALPAPDRKVALVYALRLTVTVLIATEIYHRWGVQSGYWIPMTALLVQKPAFFETLTRGVLRVLGTLAGATLATMLARHLQMGPWELAGLATFFAFWSFRYECSELWAVQLVPDFIHCVSAEYESAAGAGDCASAGVLHDDGGGDCAGDSPGCAKAASGDWTGRLRRGLL